jgi:hypothetical protein
VQIDEQRVDTPLAAADQRTNRLVVLMDGTDADGSREIRSGVDALVA